MNAPLPHIIRPPSSERDQTIMRPHGGDDTCLQVPTTSDYLIPLPGITHIQHQQYQQQQQQQQITNNNCQETATSPMSAVVNACTPPGVASPSAPGGNVETNGTNAADGGHWETSFILPNSKSDQPLLNSNSNGSQKSINTTSMGNGNHGPAGNTSGYSSSSQRSPVSNGLRTMPPNSAHHAAMPHPHDIDEETKLISLDTPQPTPTTIQPPLSFSSQLDGITLDPAALTKSLNMKTTVPIITTTTAAAAATTTTNATNNNKHSQYANIQMMSSSLSNLKANSPADATTGSCSTTGVGNAMLLAAGANVNANTISAVGVTEKLNGSLLHNGTKLNGQISAGGGSGANTPPFTIQGYTERYKDKHSEISC